MKRVAFGIVLVCVAGSAIAEQLDQWQTLYNGGTSARTLPGYTIWQSFRAGLTGQMTRIDMGFFNDMSGSGRLDILSGDGTGGTILQTLTVPVVGITQSAPTWNSWVVNAPVTEGQMYTFNFTPNAATLPDPYGVCIGAGNPYTAGVMGIDDPGGSYRTTFDLNFKTYVSTVPEPATLLALGGALSAFMLRRRRSRAA